MAAVAALLLGVGLDSHNRRACHDAQTCLKSGTPYFAVTLPRQPCGAA